MHKVFIYGTLKKGFPNYDRYMHEKYYICKCKTIDPYPLVVANKYYSPVLINEKGNGVIVSGELYEIDKRTIERLDRLEGVDTDWGYTKHTIDIITDSGEVTQGFAYMKDRESLTTIHSKVMVAYELDKRYVLPCDRD